MSIKAKLLITISVLIALAFTTVGAVTVTVTRDRMVDRVDATLVTAHSDKEGAEPTHKKTFGFAPMCAFVDHGEHGALLRSLRQEAQRGQVDHEALARRLATAEPERTGQRAALPIDEPLAPVNNRRQQL